MDDKLRKSVISRGCQGKFLHSSRDSAVRLCDCPCHERFKLDPCHIDHRGMGGSKLKDTEDNLLCMCRPSHDLFDGRITEREWNRLMGIERGEE